MGIIKLFKFDLAALKIRSPSRHYCSLVDTTQRGSFLLKGVIISNSQQGENTKPRAYPHNKKPNLSIPGSPNNPS